MIWNKCFPEAAHSFIVPPLPSWYSKYLLLLQLHTTLTHLPSTLPHHFPLQSIISQLGWILWEILSFFHPFTSHQKEIKINIISVFRYNFFLFFGNDDLYSSVLFLLLNSLRVALFFFWVKETIKKREESYIKYICVFFAHSVSTFFLSSQCSSFF